MNSNLKVLHVIARMNLGGTARYVGALASAIPLSKIATGYTQEYEIEDSSVSTLPIIRIPHLGRKLSPINDLRAWIELRREIERFRPDIVHTHTFKAGLIGRLIPGNHSRIHTFHGHLFDDDSFSSIGKFLVQQIERVLARRTDILISVGNRVGLEIRKRNIGRHKIWESIPPGIAPFPKIRTTNSRKTLGLPTKGFLVGWMARVTEVKNPIQLVELARSLPEVKFVMAGGGNLMNIVAENAPENLIILGWTDASLFWSAVDICLSTSINEGMPISLIEAQMSGVPVVATDVGSTSEVVEDRVTGFITQLETRTIADAILSLSRDKQLVSQMGLAASERATKVFSLKKMINSHLSLYLNASLK